MTFATVALYGVFCLLLPSDSECQPHFERIYDMENRRALISSEEFHRRAFEYYKGSPSSLPFKDYPWRPPAGRGSQY